MSLRWHSGLSCCLDVSSKRSGSLAPGGLWGRRNPSGAKFSVDRALIGLRAAAARQHIVKCSAATSEDVGGGGKEWDVSSNCVTPVFRISPVTEEEAVRRKGQKIHILFLSEGNVCRSIYAEAIFSALLRQHGLEDVVCCSSKATRDYNVGETADPRAVAVADEQGLKLLEGKVAKVFDCSSDVVVSDLLLVMDKFTASDVLKEVTVLQIANKQSSYSSKVRRLGEFSKTRTIYDIDDPLYFNSGGPEELESVREVYDKICHSCQGLIDFILQVQAGLEGSQSLQEGVALSLGRMNALNWLAPPMLSKVPQDV